MIQGLLNDISNESAIVTTHCFNTFAVHLVWLGWLRPEHACIALLVHQQVREVHFFELQLNRVDKVF